MRITDLPILTTASLNDIMYIIDKSDTSDFLSGSSKQITVNDLFANISSGTTLETGSTYPITSSWALSSISSSYARTASYLNTTYWISSSFTSSVISESVAAFNSTGKPILVTPDSNNTYLAFKNNILKWIPLSTLAIAILASDFSQEENVSDTPLTILAGVSFVTSYTSASI